MNKIFFGLLIVFISLFFVNYSFADLSSVSRSMKEDVEHAGEAMDSAAEASDSAVQFINGMKRVFGALSSSNEDDDEDEYEDSEPRVTKSVRSSASNDRSYGKSSYSQPAVTRSSYNYTKPTSVSYSNTRSSFSNYSVVNANALRLRSGPSTRHSVITKLYRGDRVQVRGCSSKWFLVYTSRGYQGWVASQYISR